MARTKAAPVLVHTDITSHGKFTRLAQLLDISHLETAGLITLLLRYAKTTDPENGAVRGSAQVVAGNLFWTRSPRELRDALVQSGWLEQRPDGLYIHEWHLYQGAAARRSSDKERRARALNQTRIESIDVPCSAEAEMVHDLLMGKDHPARKVNLARVDRLIARFPNQDAYEVALGYVAWQADVAAQYERTRMGRKPQSDPIRGFQNQMIMANRNNMSLRQEKPAQTPGPLLDFTPEDVGRYA
ncbi:MAG: hypothetical protein LC754_10500 [Acidobacteria bacterium]|nr:hypothetical protein [Acidobacteriota bacterium]